MAQVHGKGTTVLYDGQNLSGDLTSFDVALTVDSVDTSTMDPATNQDHKFIVGMRSGTATFNAIWNDAANAIDETIANDLAASQATRSCMMIPNNVEGSRAFAAADVLLTAYNVSGGISDAVKATGTFISSGGFNSGKLLHELSAETSAANTTGARDSGANLTYPTTKGGKLIFIVTTITGGNVIMSLQHATTQGGVYSTLSTLATLTAAGSAVIDIAAGVNINEFTRAIWTQTATTWTGALVFIRYL